MAFTSDQEKKGGRLPSTSLFGEDGPYDWDEFKRVFFETEDVYEYRAALTLVGSWDEWNRLKRDSTAFRNAVESWVIELRVILQSKSFERVLQLSRSDTASALAASKWIIEQTEGGGTKTRTRRGAPTKKDIAAAAAIMARDDKQERNEAERVRAAALGEI